MSAHVGPKGPRPNDAKTGEKGQPMAPIPSASLVVLCPVSGTSKGGSINYATLMVQRSARDGSSFRSAVVFPGGALDLADEDAVQRMAKGKLSACTSGSQEDSDSVDAAYAHSLRLCALRETFEETGLLLVPSEDTPSQKSRAIGPKEAGMEPKEWARIREEIHNDARAFPPFLSRIVKVISPSLLTTDDDNENILPPLAPMQHHSNWVTPRSVVRPAKRFDAHFFLTVLDKADALGPLTSASNNEKSSEDLLNLSADGTETTSLRLATPSEMVELTIRDEIVLFPPQFYILADLAAVLRINHSSKSPSLPALIFRHPTNASSSSSSPNGVTTVEEEPRALHPDSIYQFEKQSDSGRGSSLLQGTKSVTSVEPHPMPRSGSNVSNRSLSFRGNGEQQSSHITDKPVNKSGLAEREDLEEDEPFVFPLVLPGDFLASKDQQDNMSGSKPVNAQSILKPLNRLYVTPRIREDGGGLIVRGARRRGLPGLIDFEEGAQLDELGAGQDTDGHSNHRSKL